MDNNKEERKQWLIDRNNEYRIGKTTISDYEYDRRLAEYILDYPEDEDISKKAIIEKVPNSKEKVKLPIAMYSLEKDHNLKELFTWVKSKKIKPDSEIVIMPKFDSISLCVDEIKNDAFTRGEGDYGQYKPEHYKHIKSGEKDIFTQQTFTFGEAIIIKSDWNEYFYNKINPNTKKLYSNGRNTVAGFFSNDIIRDEQLKHVSYIRYGLVNTMGETLNKADHLDVLNIVNEVKVPYVIAKLNDTNLESIFNEKYTEWKEYFDIDGIVIELNDYHYRNLLGREKNNNPAYSRAYKDPNWNETKSSPVVRINKNVSKQGLIKPVIEIEPISISGVIVSNVTGNNMRYILENNIAPNSIIEIIRSGEVIPKHINTISYNQDDIDKLNEELLYCPSCGEKTSWNENKVELICTNKDCKGMRLSKLIYFFTTLGIDNFGEGEINKLFNAGYDTPEKIINITYYELLNIEGWADKSITKLLDQFNKLIEKGVPIATLIQALDLFDGKLGAKVAKKIFEEANDNLEYSNLININGVDEITANAFIKAYNTYTSQYMQFPIPAKFPNKSEIINGKYSGFSICMTGFRDSELEETIIANGGKIASGVSKTTTHLLVKEKESASNKAKKAKALGTIILTKEEFLTLFN